MNWTVEPTLKARKVNRNKKKTKNKQKKNMARFHGYHFLSSGLLKVDCTTKQNCVVNIFKCIGGKK